MERSSTVLPARVPPTTGDLMSRMFDAVSDLGLWLAHHYRDRKWSEARRPLHLFFIAVGELCWRGSMTWQTLGDVEEFLAAMKAATPSSDPGTTGEEAA